MADINKKYYRYQMTFPFEGHKIYKSKSLNKIVNKCYKEFIRFSDIGDGLFCVTNIDKEVEYRFKVKNKKVYKVKEVQTVQAGAALTEGELKDKLAELAVLDDDNRGPDPVNVTVLKSIDANVSITNKNVDSLKTLVETANKNITSVSGKIDTENTKLNEIKESITKQQAVQHPEVSQDLYEDVDDIFQHRLNELATLRKIESLEENQTYNCLIL